MPIWYDSGSKQVVLPPVLRVPLPPALLRFGGGYFHLPTKVCLVKAMVFPVVMYGCESWTVKKAEC